MSEPPLTAQGKPRSRRSRKQVKTSRSTKKRSSASSSSSSLRSVGSKKSGTNRSFSTQARGRFGELKNETLRYIHSILLTFSSPNSVADSVRSHFARIFDRRVEILVDKIVHVEDEYGNGSFGQNPKEKWGVFQEEVDELVSSLYDFIEWMSREIVGGMSSSATSSTDSRSEVSRIYILSEMLDAIFGAVYTSKQGLKHVWNKGILDKKQDFFCLSKILDRFPELKKYCDEVAQGRMGPDKNMSWTEVVQDLRNIRLRTVGHLLKGSPLSGQTQQKEEPAFQHEAMEVETDICTRGLDKLDDQAFANSSWSLSEMSASTTFSFMPPAVETDSPPRFLAPDFSMEDVLSPPNVSSSERTDVKFEHQMSPFPTSSNYPSTSNHLVPEPTTFCRDDQPYPQRQTMAQPVTITSLANMKSAAYLASPLEYHPTPSISERLGSFTYVQNGGQGDAMYPQQSVAQPQEGGAFARQQQTTQRQSHIYLQQQHQQHSFSQHSQQTTQHQQAQRQQSTRMSVGVTPHNRDDAQWSFSIPQGSSQYADYQTSYLGGRGGGGGRNGCGQGNFLVQPVQSVQRVQVSGQNVVHPQFQTMGSTTGHVQQQSARAVYVLDQSMGNQQQTHGFEVDADGDEACIFDTDVSSRHLLDSSQEYQLSRLAANGKLSNGSLIGL